MSKTSKAVANRVLGELKAQGNAYETALRVEIVRELIPRVEDARDGYESEYGDEIDLGGMDDLLDDLKGLAKKRKWNARDRTYAQRLSDDIDDWIADALS